MSSMESDTTTPRQQHPKDPVTGPQLRAFDGVVQNCDLLARRLMAVPMGRQLGGRVCDGAMRFLKRLRGWVPDENSFSTRDARQREEASKSAVYGWLGELHEAGLLDKLEGQRGRSPAVWRLTADSLNPENTAILPTVEEICP